MKVALTVVGALAEFIALVLVVRDFYDARSRADRMLLRPVGASLVQRAAIRPEDMTPEQRDELRAADLKASVVLALTSPSREDLRAVEVREDDLREKIAAALRGNTRSKWASIVLLAVGIALSAVANLI